MKIIEQTKTLKVLPEGDNIRTHLLLNWRKKQNDDWLYIENNVINRLVLGLDPFSFLNPTNFQLLNWRDSRLEPFQQADIRKGAELGNVLNRNKMGLGKTVETIKMLQSMNACDVVIVAPKVVCPQWKVAFENWWPEVADTVELYNPNAKICVVNYEKLRNNRILDLLCYHQHDAVVFDEAHKLKNRKAQQTIAAKLIPAKWHIALTGTPILRQPDDLWSILHAIDWHYSGNSYWQFVNYFCNVVQTPFGRKIEGLTADPAKLNLLRCMLECMSIYNPDISVAQGKRVTTVQLDMPPQQKSLYKKIKNLVLDELPKNCTIANGAVHAMRLQQTTSWPGLFDVSIAGAKFEWILEFCQNTDEQIVILTKYSRTAEALKTYLWQKGMLNSVLYTGQQTEQVKQGNKERFMKGEVRILIGTIDAVGTGVDGLQVARLGIMLDRDWSPMVNEQCEDRLNRKGQDRPVRWYYLECKQSFDKHVTKVNLAKADAIRKALEED